MKIERFEDIDPSASQARRAGRGLATITWIDSKSVPSDKETKICYKERKAINRELW